MIPRLESSYAHPLSKWLFRVEKAWYAKLKREKYLSVTCQVVGARLMRLLSDVEVHGHWTQFEQSISLQRSKQFWDTEGPLTNSERNWLEVYLTYIAPKAQSMSNIVDVACEGISRIRAKFNLCKQ